MSYTYTAGADVGNGLSSVTHMYFTDVVCLEMPHLAHMCFAICVAILMAFVTICYVSEGSCGVVQL